MVSERQTNRGLLERLDPPGEARRATRAVMALTSRPARALLRVLGADASDVDSLGELSRQVHRNMDDLARQERLLCPLGWMVFERSPSDAYVAAADLVERGRVDDAEELLCAAWNADRAALLRGPLHQVMGLYTLPDDDDLVEGTIAFHRSQEIGEAVALHLEGRYRGAIQIALSQMDGIAADLSPRRRGLFSRGGLELTDEATAVGHPANLAQMQRLLTERCPDTTTLGRLLRHGIIHGRELGYATEVNSTKALVALLALIVFGLALGGAVATSGEAAGAR